jgi:hypothetical protein
VAQALVTVSNEDKREALRRLIASEQVKNALIFCNRTRDVDILYRSLKKHGMNVGALHGDMDQSTRTATLDAFKRNEMTILVCSDVAARGLDIDDLSHVFNFDVPIHAEDYVHRIGRTGARRRSAAPRAQWPWRQERTQRPQRACPPARTRAASARRRGGTGTSSGGSPDASAGARTCPRTRPDADCRGTAARPDRGASAPGPSPPRASP